jgi:hypothetical protein
VSLKGHCWHSACAPMVEEVDEITGGSLRV